MYSFQNDYSEGAHPKVMERLLEVNEQQHVGYGEDEWCQKARRKIQETLACDHCDVHFLVGGTQANLTVIASSLRPYEAVIAVDSGHINVHETGAIEASGHKVLTVTGIDGKMTAKEVRDVCRMHSDEHMVKPKMVYISNASEIGTIYHEQELRELSHVCRELGLYLFMDGARMGAALTAKDNDVRFADLCKYCDVLYLGGTKNGLLFGEAVVIVNDELKKDFRYMMKQRGGMLAKGWLLGVQFYTLFEDALFSKIGAYENRLAQKIQNAFLEHDIALFIETTTNQIFPIVTMEMAKALQKEFRFQPWAVVDDDHMAIRLVTSWATKEEEVDRLIAYIASLPS